MNKSELLSKIEKFVLEKDYASARKLIRNDLKRLGSKFEYYFYMGYASTDVEERMKNYEKAYELEPENLDVLINLSNVKDEMGDYESAINGYNKVLEKDASNALVYNNRGYSYFQKGDYEKALDDYSNALRLSPKLKIAECNREELINILKDDKRYSELVEKSNELQNDYMYHFNLGIQEMNSNNTNEALFAFNKVIDLNPSFATVYMFIGIIEFQQENYEKAYEYYTKAIERDSKLIDAYFNRAQIVFGTKTEDKDILLNAISDLEQAVNLDNKFVDAYYSMAVIYKNLGEYKKSIELLDKILEIDEQSINARALKKLLIKKYLN